MSLQELSFKQINEALKLATEKTVPITLTFRREGIWTNLPSRMLTIAGDRLLVELPPLQDDVAPHEFVPAEKIGVAFKLKHHKQIFTATVAGVINHNLQGQTIPLLALCLPTRMQRLQRRMYYRADVPGNRIVRASFWMGGREGEPNGTSAESPVWSGQVTNISAGGFQLTSSVNPTPTLEVGDSAGVRISFGSGQEAVYADAQFRHLVIEGQGVTMGFQFVGLPLTSEGRESLRLISQKVSEFQQAMEQQVTQVQDL